VRPNKPRSKPKRCNCQLRSGSASQTISSQAYLAALISSRLGLKRSSGGSPKSRPAHLSFPWKTLLLVLAEQSREDFPQRTGGA
jgi:hypothetical protein